MDKLYIGDIPQNYCYADFNTNYIDLYNTATLNPQSTYDYYRIYLYDNQFAYDHLSRNTGYNYYDYLSYVNVSSEFMYRRDFDSIVVMTFIFAIFGLWLFNMISSCIRKGGVLGGLF